MALIPPETVEQIQAANDIVEVVGSYFPLKRSGPVFKALCPFHQERTPSFTVNPARQIFKCFGCGAGGSVIRFVMTYENLDFIAAAKKLAERAGVKIEEAEMSADDSARFTMRRRLLALHAEAAEFFHQQLLKKPSAQVARDYLKSRGISAEVARSWKLGYAPEGWDAMRGLAANRGYSEEELVESGLVKTRDDEQTDTQNSTLHTQTSRYYDRFRGRVMFPICNDLGEVIAFSGRVLEADAKAAKYLNSPETMLFSKGAVLFGLHRSKRALIEKSSAIVCEGQLDLLTAFEAGVRNVIAPQGTAFTEKQARILRRFVDEVVLCFDSDAAGAKAAERSLAALLAENLLVRVAAMPPGEDPDSLIRARGAAAFQEFIDHAQDFFDFQLERLAAQPDFESPRGRMQAARKMAEWISLLADPMLRETIMNKVSVRLEVSAAEFRRLLKQPRPLPTDRDELKAAVAPIQLEPTMRLLALVALHDPDARSWLLEEHWPELLADDPEAALLKKVLSAEIEPANPASANAFLATLDASEEAAVSGLLGERPPEHAMTIAHDCWRELERRKILRKRDALMARQRRPNQPVEEETKLQEEILALQKRLSDIARPLSPPL